MKKFDHLRDIEAVCMERRGTKMKEKGNYAKGKREEGKWSKGEMTRGERGRKGCSKMPASAVKAVWALCRECVRTCAHWCAFAQSALTPFKVTAS